VFENRVLRIMYGHKGKKIKEEWGKKLHNEGLLYFYSSCSIIRAIKSEGMWQNGHEAHIEEVINEYRIVFENFNAIGQAGKPDLYSRTVFRYLIHNYECATRVP